MKTEPGWEDASCRSGRPSSCRRVESCQSCASSAEKNSRTFSTLSKEGNTNKTESFVDSDDFSLRSIL